jgi:predicted GNAT family acetyltransferase
MLPESFWDKLRRRKKIRGNKKLFICEVSSEEEQHNSFLQVIFCAQNIPHRIICYSFTQKTPAMSKIQMQAGLAKEDFKTAEDHNILDSIIWQALSTNQSHMSVGDDFAKRFHPEISLLAAIREPTVECLTHLRSLLSEEDNVRLLTIEKIPDQLGFFDSISHYQVYQMIRPFSNETTCIGDVEDVGVDIQPLTEEDTTEMMALTNVTQPGPFSIRTREMGTFLGIKINGTLAAMAGERLHASSWREVSGVCTDPSHRGKGYAKILIKKILDLHSSRKQNSFLHVLVDNSAGVKLYESLGFEKRAILNYYILASKKQSSVSTNN